jgi:hypothetical protein
MAAKPLRAMPYAALLPSHSHRKSGQSICFKTGQFYLLLTCVWLPLQLRIGKGMQQETLTHSSLLAMSFSNDYQYSASLL